MPNALFDPIINSEDEMLMRAHLQGRKYHACTYLRAYIMASLCFEPKLVVTDTAAILNKAFRTLIDKKEGPDYNWEYLPETEDFDWLISEGHIEFAARKGYSGLFSDLAREFREKQRVDLPSGEYTEKIDEIYRNKNIHKYDIGEASKEFTFNFRKQIRKESEDHNTLPEMTKILQDLTYILSDKEILTYNMVKNVLQDQLGLNEKDPKYQHIRGILRQSYDYNIPKLLHLDYCRSLQGIKPSRKQDWKLELDREKAFKVDFDCSVYGLAALPARNLRDIWESKEYVEFERQLKSVRENAFKLEEYMEALSQYLSKINDVIKNNYDAKYNSFSGKGMTKLKVRARHYFCSDSTCIVIGKSIGHTYHVYDAVSDWKAFMVSEIFDKVIPSVAQKIDGFPSPPEEMREAVVIKSKKECDEIG